MAGRSGRRWLPLVAVALTIVVVGVGGAVWWTGKQTYEVTDNAFVQADKVVIASLVEGYVSQVLVADNQLVKPGDLLVRIDPATLQARLAEAEANARALDAAVDGVDDKAALERAMIAQKAAGVDNARAEAQLAAAELQRYGALAKEGWVSPQRAQTARAAQAQAAASVTEASATLEAQRRSAEALGSARSQTQAQAAAAHAAADGMRIALSRAEIRAPVAGAVGGRSVRAGQYVRSGGPMMTIVPVDKAYVIANFKETQVARLRIGQPVEIHADAFGGRKLTGRIESFSPTTGSEFALIPVENAVGNFTKITQRLPVRIAVDREGPLAAGLRPGLSIKVKVDVTQDTGPTFAEAAAAPARYARQATPSRAAR